MLTQSILVVTEFSPTPNPLILQLHHIDTYGDVLDFVKMGLFIGEMGLPFYWVYGGTWKKTIDSRCYLGEHLTFQSF
jgi:hypothetical protein